jgi:hypothetical protein
LSREDAAVLQYRIRPYLRGANRGQLRERLEDVLRNLYTITPVGKVGLTQLKGVPWTWPEKLGDLRHEYGLRGIRFEDDVSFKDLPFHREALDAVKKNPTLGDYHAVSRVFCKFGKREHMEGMLREGIVRVAPASTFYATQHNAARRDNEMMLTTHITPYDYDLGLLDPYFKRIMPTRRFAMVEHRKPSDHYLYCVSVAFDCRLFFDFDADSCVVVRNQDEFVRRLKGYLSWRLPGWTIYFDMVKYFDPYFICQRLPAPRDDIFFFKHFRYMYQHEHRLVAIPPEDWREPLRPMFLKLGSLEEIAKIVLLRSD